MSEREWTPEERVFMIRKIAVRVAKMTEGESTREVIDGLALAAGALLHNYYQTPVSREIAVRQFAKHFTNAAFGRDLV